METKDLITESFEGQCNGLSVRIRSNRTIIIEQWSGHQGTMTNSKYLYVCPDDLYEIAVKQAAGQLPDDVPDCRAMIDTMYHWFRRSEPIRTLRTGFKVQ